MPDDAQELTDIELEQAEGVEGFVNRCYKIALGREADKEGFNNWVSNLQSHKITAIQTAFGFLFSTEYMSKKVDNDTYVTNLYQLMLGRESDPAGKKNWVDQLNNGACRQDIFAGFANSVEFCQICDSYGVIQGYYKAGFDVGQSSKITAFVLRLYADCLSRTGENPGVTDWTRQLVEGSNTGAGVAYGFLFSPEFLAKSLSCKDFTTIMYKTFLGRDPEPEGLENWVSQLFSGASMESVFSGFANSAEFSDLCTSYGIIKGDYAIPGSGLHYLHGVLEVSNESVNLYALHVWFPDGYPIPENYSQSNQIYVSGTQEKPVFRSMNGLVNVSETGLVSTQMVTYYVDPIDGSVSLVPSGDPDQYSYEDMGIGQDRIEITVGEYVLYVEVNVIDYSKVNLENTVNKFIAEQLTSSMTMPEKVEKICKYMAAFGIDDYYHTAEVMIVTGCGDVYAYLELFEYFCDKLDILHRDNNKMYNTIISIDDGCYVVGFTYAGGGDEYLLKKVPEYNYGPDNDLNMSLLDYYGFDPVVTVNETYKDKPVTNIGNNAFAYHTYLKNVNLPDSITYIGTEAFYVCKNLETCEIPSGVKELGRYAFAYTGIKTITLPEELEFINAGCFSDCTNLKSIVIPAKIDHISSYTFSGCTSLSDVTLPEGLKVIDDYVFVDCSSLKSITIPDSTYGILGDSNFMGCAEGFTIKGSAGSYAEKYANEHKIPFQAI